MRIRLAAATAVAVLGAALTACANTTDDSIGQESTNPASSQSARPGTGSVWVADQEGDSLTVLDAATNAVATTVTGLKHPHNVQVSRDGSRVYAVTGDNRVVAIDATNYTVDAVAPTGPAPAHVIEAPNDKVYVTNADDGAVSVYQTAGLTPVGRIDLGGMPHGLRAADDGSVVVVANTSAGTLDLIDPTTDQRSGEVPVGSQPAQVAVSADGRYAYAGVTGSTATSGPFTFVVGGGGGGSIGTTSSGSPRRSPNIGRGSTASIPTRSRQPSSLWWGRRPRSSFRLICRASG